MNKIAKLVIAILIPLAVGAIGGFSTYPEIQNWYAQLNKPSWNPPNGIFGPVWTTLYILMGIALYLIWANPADERIKRRPYFFFVLQLILNLFWSIIFFHYHQIGIALAEIAVLWIFILLTIFSFARFSKPAAWLLVPYISWVSFAMILNYTIWKIN